MTTVWNAAEVPATERAAAVREAVGGQVVRVDIDLPDDPHDVAVAEELAGRTPATSRSPRNRPRGDAATIR